MAAVLSDPGRVLSVQPLDRRWDHRGLDRLGEQIPALDRLTEHRPLDRRGEHCVRGQSSAPIVICCNCLRVTS